MAFHRSTFQLATPLQLAQPHRPPTIPATSASDPLRHTETTLAMTQHTTLMAAPILDRHTYECLIGDANALYVQGKRTLHIDLRQTSRIEQSGLFAIYCVHLIFQGEPLPDQEGGMALLRYVTERVYLDGTQSVRLIHVADNLLPLLQRAGFWVQRL